MWYSSTQVGISEIDMDHQNIDAMLQLCFSGHVPEAVLENVITGLFRHFEHEEAVIKEMGFEFPSAHHEEHAALSKYIRAMQADWQSGKISGKELAEALRLKLFLHVSEFDLKLKDL